MSNPFADWKQADVDAWNAKVKKKPEATPVPRALVEGHIKTDLIIRPSHDEARLNKLEKSWLYYLRLLKYPWIGVQSVTLKLGDDCRYTPDFVGIGFKGELIAWETKGFWRDDAKVKIKVAARHFRFIKFVVVERKKGQWIETPINP